MKDDIETLRAFIDPLRRSATYAEEALAALERLEKDRDSIRAKLDARWEADQRAAKAIFAKTGRTQGFPDVKEVVAYYMTKAERVGALLERAKEALNRALQLKGGWREAIVELEDFCSEPVRLRNMLAAADQLDDWAAIARAVLTELSADAPAQQCPVHGKPFPCCVDFDLAKPAQREQAMQELADEAQAIGGYDAPAQQTQEVQLKPGWLLDDVRKAAARLEPAQQAPTKPFDEWTEEETLVELEKTKAGHWYK